MRDLSQDAWDQGQAISLPAQDIRCFDPTRPSGKPGASTGRIGRSAKAVGVCSVGMSLGGCARAWGVFLSGGFGERLGARGVAVLAELGAQGAHADPERFGRLFPMAAELLQRGLDQSPFHLFEAEP